MQRLRILIVDDEDFNRDGMALFLRPLLRNTGVEVHKARSGRGALIVLEEHSRDTWLVLSDLIMPGLNGFDLSRSLQRREGDSKIDVLFVLLSTSSVDQRTALAAGADRFISKDLGSDAVCAELREIVGSFLGVKAA